MESFEVVLTCESFHIYYQDWIEKVKESRYTLDL